MNTRRFFLGFVFTFVLFIMLVLLTAHFMSDCGLPAVLGVSGCADDVVRVGFPFQFYERGGLAYRNEFWIGPLVLDIVIGLVLSGLFGLWWERRKGIDVK